VRTYADASRVRGHRDLHTGYQSAGTLNGEIKRRTEVVGTYIPMAKGSLYLVVIMSHVRGPPHPTGYGTCLAW